MNRRIFIYTLIVLPVIELCIFLLFVYRIVQTTPFEIPPNHADAAIVLGTTVNYDGSLSPRLQARLNASLTLFQQNRIEYIIVSGGLGKEGFYEGDKMRDYLLAQGVPETQIIVDNYGNNTFLTIQNFQDIKLQRQINSVIVVSQYFHLPRTIALLEPIPDLQVAGGYSPYFFEWRDIFSVPRECIAYYLYPILHK